MSLPGRGLLQFGEPSGEGLTEGVGAGPPALPCERVEPVTGGAAYTHRDDDAGVICHLTSVYMVYTLVNVP
jgi:hypothetical protein